ncbi:MAG: hypothetical protein ACRDHE_06445, partial [Ktedonobacterales bacterium]
FGVTARRVGEMFATATLTGVLAWLGAGLHLLAFTLARLGQPASSGIASVGSAPALDLGAVIGTLVVVSFAVGCVYAAGAGLLGAAARSTLTRLVGRVDRAIVTSRGL